jgi:hypothetical protein
MDSEDAAARDERADSTARAVSIVLVFELLSSLPPDLYREVDEGLRTSRMCPSDLVRTKEGRD